MKYIIDGKPAYQVAKEHGVNINTFYQRTRRGGWSTKDAATKHRRNSYYIKKDGEIKTICFSTEQVAKYLGTTKNTICGLFFRKGKKIELFGYTIERRVHRENKKDSNL